MSKAPHVSIISFRLTDEDKTNFLSNIADETTGEYNPFPNRYLLGNKLREMVHAYNNNPTAFNNFLHKILS